MNVDVAVSIRLGDKPSMATWETGARRFGDIPGMFVRRACGVLSNLLRNAYV